MFVPHMSILTSLCVKYLITSCTINCCPSQYVGGGDGWCQVPLMGCYNLVGGKQWPCMALPRVARIARVNIQQLNNPWVTLGIFLWAF